MSSSAPVSSTPPPPSRKPSAPSGGPSTKTDSPPQAPAEAPSASPTDTTEVSSEATETSPDDWAKTDERAQSLKEAYGDEYSAEKMTLDTWGEGPNDTVEAMLRNQGFSLQDIHNKDEDGKTMVDRVAQANGIQDLRRIADGKEIVVPSMGDQGAGVNTKGLENGEVGTSETVGDVTLTPEKTEDGRGQVTAEDPQINTTATSANGTAVGSARTDGETTRTQLEARDAQGRPALQANGEITPEQSSVTVTPQNGGQLTGEVGPTSSSVENRGATISTEHGDGNDGFFERNGRAVDDFFGSLNPFGSSPAEEKAVPVQGQDLSITDSRENGVVAESGGQEIARFRGDSDDGFTEWLGHQADDAWAGTKSAVGRLFSRLSSFWN